MDSKNNRGKNVICCILLLLGVLILVFLLFIIFSYKKVNKYRDEVFYNTYIDEYDISGNRLDNIDKVVDEYSEKILSKNIKFIINDIEYIYKYSDLKLSVDEKSLKKEIIEYNANLSYFDKTSIINKNKKKVLLYNFIYNEKDIKEFVIGLKNKVDLNVTNGRLNVSDSREVSYVLGRDGFSLDVEESTKRIINNLSKADTIILVGTTTKAVNDDNYKLIDTKVSSYVTEFNPYISRATNLKTGLNYIDGVVINPGEVFSFYKYAGPYNKRGYVFYYEFVGNGVCQIATTVYNAALLGGLEIVKRYPHAKKSVYVPGGLDATVASYAGGWNVDFQFKNTYKYPIYISAYAIGNKAHVDFWSNSNAKEGKTYTTESVKLGARYYKTYLHTFQNGTEIDKKLIASTWYTEE